MRVGWATSVEQGSESVWERSLLILLQEGCVNAVGIAPLFNKIPQFMDEKRSCCRESIYIEMVRPYVCPYMPKYVRTSFQYILQGKSVT